MNKISKLMIFDYRGKITAFFIAGLCAAVAVSSPLVHLNTFAGTAMLILGWVFFVLFCTIRLWATLYIGGRKSRELQTEGPFSVTRNPLYLGNFCFTLSSALFLQSLSLLVVVVIASVLYMRYVIKAEEKLLHDVFGDAFDEYVRKTPMVIPNFSNYHARPTVEVNIWSLKKEIPRMWLAALIPVFSGVLVHLRTAPWWPHWFIMP